MRIIGGRLKGKTILPPRDYEARPTTDFAKEGLFNVLDNEYEFDGLKVLDLFGGTGAIAFEFASRGASRVYSVEMNRDNAKFIRSEAAKLGLDNITAVHGNVFDFLPICREKFDIIRSSLQPRRAGRHTRQSAGPGHSASRGVLHPGARRRIFVLRTPAVQEGEGLRPRAFQLFRKIADSASVIPDHVRLRTACRPRQ